MTNITDVDAALLKWATRFNERQTARVTARSITGLPVKRRRLQRATSPDEVRSRLKGIVQRRPQVMVRISGGGRGMRPIRAHLNYISRNGQLAVEDQDGERLMGQHGVGSLAKEWQGGGFPIEDISTRREAYNIVLSMPAGTDALALHRAARAFAKDEFEGHQFAMVLHTFESDPNREPSENPHVHLCVKARGIDGIRINPRKDDLRRWRERFAECLREQGVEAEATSRSERFQPTPGKRQAIYHQLTDRRAQVSVVSPARKSKKAMDLSASYKDALKSYSDMAWALAGSTAESDRDLAVAIVRTAERVEDRAPHREVDRGINR
jgi:hypothetical protein